MSEIGIADSLPYGISVLKNSLFVADASSKGGLWKINLLTRQWELVLANSTTTIQCVHGVAVHGEKVYFTDRQARKVYQLENENVSVSVQMMLQSAKELKTSANHINPQFLELIKPSSMLRSRNPSSLEGCIWQISSTAHCKKPEHERQRGNTSSVCVHTCSPTTCSDNVRRCHRKC